MGKHLGKQTIQFDKPPVIAATAAIAGPKEGDGPLGAYFDRVLEDSLLGEKSWEAAESKIAEETMKLAVKKSKLVMEDIQYIFAGDLLNQNTASTFGVRNLERPYFGIFGACSTFGEGLSLGAIMLDSGSATNVLVSASSHFCSAEKQFRYPLEFGTQRPPTSSWTVTGDGAAVLSCRGQGPKITFVTTGKVVDMGITDMNNMGAAMAPAAADTLAAHFKDTGRSPGYYDVIATGDLGHYGKEITVQLLADQNIIIGGHYTDCGIEVFDQKSQDTHAGGSGCACSAITFAAYYYHKLINKEITKMLLVPTGALLSPTSSQQGESIPGIAHAVAIEMS